MKSKHTDEQLAWLRSYLSDYETRAGGNVRGDAKKFALEKASKYIEKWGIPEGEKETTMKEQIYTWFKNTSARGKEARKRHQLMKKAERPSTAYLTVPNIEQPAQANGSASQLRYQAQPQSLAQPPPPQPPPQAQTPHYPPPLPPPSYTATPLLSPFSCNIRDSILNPNCEASDLATVMQLCPDMPEIIAAVFAAVILVTSTPQPDLVDPVQHVMHRYSAAISLWPRTMIFKGFSGPHSGRHLLQYAIRKHAIWSPHPPFSHHAHDLQEELTRLTLDRQRKRDHVLWARIHATSIQIGLIENTWLAETLTNDAAWEETDEIEWVGGCVLLKGLVRAGKVPSDVVTGTWADLMQRYQSKWKEVRDEGRQALMAETLLDIRKTLEAHARM